MKSSRARAHRWLAVLSHAALGTLLFLVLLGFQPDFFFWVLQLPNWTVPSCALSLLLFFPLAEFGSGWGLPFLQRKGTPTSHWCAYLGLRHAHTYPSVWQAGLLGTGLLLLSLGLFPVPLPAVLEELRATEWCVTKLSFFSFGVSFVAFSLLLVLGSWNLRRFPCKCASPSPLDSTSPTQPPRHSAPKLQELTDEEFEAWLKNDEAIDDPKQDYFGLHKLAERMARRLLEENKSHVVLGQVGTGKTSLARLVERRLCHDQRDSRLLFVRVSSWEFDTPTAAVHGVLKQIVETLASQVNVYPLRGLSQSYVRALSATGVPGSLAASFLDPSSPHQVLKQIEEVLAATDLRLVVWLEDAERFIGSGNTDPHSKEERLRLLRSLTYGLDQLSRVSVVTAIAEARNSFDFEKIARHIEEIPRLPQTATRELLERFRERQILRFKEDVDAVPPSIRKTLNPIASPQRRGLRPGAKASPHTLDGYLIGILETPRRLKHALRAVLDSWEILHGEVDFDDLFVITLLRETCIQEYDVIRSNREHLTQWTENFLQDEFEELDKLD